MTTGSVQDEMAYKDYRKVYKKVLGEAEQNYYYQQFDLKSNSIKQVWSNLNDTASLSNVKLAFLLFWWMDLNILVQKI